MLKLDDSPKNEYDYFKLRKPGHTYVSKPFSSFDIQRMSKANMRYVRKVFDNNELVGELKQKNQIVMRVTHGNKQEVQAKVFEDTKRIPVLTIQRFSRETGRPSKCYFSFTGKEIANLREFIDSIDLMDFNEPERVRIDDETLRKNLLQNKRILIEALTNGVTEEDIVAVGYRKEQLKLFHDLIYEREIFIEKKKEWSKERNEDVWQYFFEKNPWIFGYGLNFVFNEPLRGKKLEQVVEGSDVSQSGKRTDGLLKTRGILSSLCLVEIKTSETSLLKTVVNPYRADCWQISDELSGGISQSHKTVKKTLSNLSPKFEVYNKNGDPTGESIFSFAPKSYLIIGSLSEFNTDKGPNLEKYSSFELLRKNIINPEVITFDELYERAKFIVHNNEEANPCDGECTAKEPPAKSASPLNLQIQKQEATTNGDQINIEGIPF